MAVNNSKKNVTVQKVELNGNNIDLSHPFVKHSGTIAVIHHKVTGTINYVYSELISGGSLVFWMKE